MSRPFQSSTEAIAPTVGRAAGSPAGRRSREGQGKGFLLLHASFRHIGGCTPHVQTGRLASLSS